MLFSFVAADYYYLFVLHYVHFGSVSYDRLFFLSTEIGAPNLAKDRGHAGDCVSINCDVTEHSNFSVVYE